MKNLLFIVSLFLTSYSYAENISTAQAQASVVSINAPMLIQKLSIDEKIIEITATITNNDCSTKYNVVVKEKENIKNIQTFNSCSSIIRAKIINNKLLIVLPSNNGGYISYYNDI